MKLLLMRHGEAASPYLIADQERPLTHVGQSQAMAAAGWILDQRLKPKTILVSSAKRTVETIEAVQAVCGFKAEIQIIDELYLADPETILGAIEERAGRGLTMVVGHNPGLSSLLYLRCREHQGMGTAAVCHIRSNKLAGRFDP